MKTIKTFFAFLVCFCAVCTVMNAQTSDTGTPAAATTATTKLIIKGKLEDGKAIPLGYATVTLLQNGVVKGGALTKDDGSFSIDVTEVGSYALRINAIGYKQKDITEVNILPGTTKKDLGTITVEGSEQQLQNVQIVGEKPLMKMDIDKKVFNVEKNITTAGGSAADVLQNVPSVSVDADGNVSMRGKSNINVLIDGKPATLLGGDVASALQSLPAGSIESIEVITNPSSKYDAQGMGGILNIITKKDKKMGFNGSIMGGVGTRNKYNGSLSLNVKNDKWNVFLNSNWRDSKNYKRTTTDRQNLFNDTTFHTYENQNRKRGGWFTSAGAEYTINKNNTISLTENVNLMHFGFDGTTTYDQLGEGNLSTQQLRTTHTQITPVVFSTAVDYKHKFKKPKQEITANVTYARMNANREQLYTSNYYDGNNNLVYGPVTQNAPGAGGNTSVLGQVDYTTPFLTKEGKLDAGVKTQLFWFQSDNNPTITKPATNTETDPTLTSNYNYRQNIHAAYMSLSDKFGKFSYQAGARVEYATYVGSTAALGGQQYNKNFLNLFPTIYLGYAPTETQNIYISYTRRINRPDFRQLLPFVDLSNPQDTSIGNPDLIPEYINNVELSYVKNFKSGHMLMASAYYQYTQNLIEQFRRFDSSGTTYTQPRNLSSGVTYGAEVTASGKITNFWDAMLNFNFFQNNINGANVDATLNNSGFSWFGKATTNFKLPMGFSLQINGNYDAHRVAVQSTRSKSYWVDAAIKKNLFKNAATVVVNVSDIFNTHKYTSYYMLPIYYQTVYSDRETRIGNISFTWRFGKSDIQGGGKGGGKRKPQQQDNKEQQPGEHNNNLKDSDDNSNAG